ncbi:cytochrome P450 [Salimicrobium jeotgali]|uniref:Cytochrome P450 n=1 Tax=Salimicrobium jeotgali TaxID=1230341 RepID=K2G8Q8_9BACI|nr:cytochrome P450 [Salimicrobium jeotgali]AKG03428.1 cytochrome P450 [Salimicrobium jeotgali]EKE30737.1 cytochrome P450 [Salimicrobium jeotgali]MBM7697133.1 cytochrome P450 [Salimicrobium jeotgali]
MTNHSNSQEADLFTHAFNQNPYPAFHSLQQHAPVHRTLMPDGHYAWIVTRYEDVVTVLKDQRFIKDFTVFLDEESRAQAHQSIFSRNMLFADPPDHKRLRGLVQQAFTPRMIEELRGRITEIANELIDDMQDRSQIDLIDDFAFPLPIIVICEMLGVPSEDRDKFRTWSNTLVEASNDPEKAEKVQQHMQEFTAYLQEWMTSRQENPQDDMISKLIQAEESGDRLSEQELYGVVSLLIIAGHETTVNLISNGMYALMTHPEQMRKLQEQPGLLRPAIEEMLRFEGPVEFSTDRWASETVELQGQTIHRGEHVLVALDAANRDPEAFEDPDVFDITRGRSKHLAFGKGMHFCLGAPLARVEAEVSLQALLERFPDLQLSTDASNLEWRPGILMRGLTELPVRLK